MGTLTINMDDGTLDLFRKTVKETVGEGKGKLGLASKEAFLKWIEEKRANQIAKRQIELMKTAPKRGPFVFNRGELYDRWEKSRSD